MKKYLLEIIVFVCGAVVMILELAGSRVMAPYLGTSLFVWSSLIGLILGALSLGYWYGGKIADKDPSWKQFSLIILIAAIFIGLTAWTKDIILIFINSLTRDVRLGSILAASFLFAPASAALGMVSPYAVRLKIEKIDTSGKTVGNLYAISTMGSIFGTFFAGFFLLASVGTTNLLFILAITLVLISLLAFPKNNSKKILIVIILLCGLAGSEAVRAKAEKNGLIDQDTAYQKILIYEGTDKTTGKPVRYLRTDDFAVQSGMFLNDDELVFSYVKFFRLARHFKPDPKNALMIGGAAYTYPRDFLKNYPSSTMDVVEIDPMMTELARRYFKLKDDPRLKIFHEDGRIFLNQNNKKYDMIFGDAFKSFNPPFQLATLESAKRMFDSLSDDGIIMINIISAIEGPKGELLRAEIKTLKQVFPEIMVFAVKSDDPNETQNIMLAAAKNKKSLESNDPEMKAALARLWDKKITDDMPIITDDFAPVENYLLHLIP